MPLLLVVALLLAACTTQFRNHGYAPSALDLAAITVGKDTRDSVAAAIGRPSAAGLLDNSGWYYVESRYRVSALLGEREISREVVAISFDGRGRVSNIERFGLADGRVVTLSRRITETTVKPPPLLRRLLGNVGGPNIGGLL
ncbi:MAG: outer membrane protein assembly factor BamE [Paracoccaceae bacterium]